MFYSFFFLILTKALPNSVLFTIFALILTKALQKGCFFLYSCPYSVFFFLYFSTNSNQSPTKKGCFSQCLPLFLPKLYQKRVFSVFSFILSKALPKRCFSLICSNPTQSPAKKGVFLYFCPYSNQSPTKKDVFSFFFALIPTKKGVFSTFALTLNKARHIGCFLYFYSNPNQILQQMVFFFIFALILTKSLPKRVLYSIFAHILTKAIPKRWFSSIFVLILARALTKMVFFSIFPLF